MVLIMDSHNDQRILNLFDVILNKLIKYKWPNEGLLLFRFISDFWLSLVNDKHLEEVKFCNYGITNFHQWNEFPNRWDEIPSPGQDNHHTPTQNIPTKSNEIF